LLGATFSTLAHADTGIVTWVKPGKAKKLFEVQLTIHLNLDLTATLARIPLTAPLSPGGCEEAGRLRVSE
jgi:hypothetical protein